MDRLFAGLGALAAFLAVALGAFAAHTLRGRLGADALATFEIGARYQMYHALALLASPRRNAVLVMRFQSIAHPPRPLAGNWEGAG